MMVRALLLSLLVLCAGPAFAHKPSDSYLALDVAGKQVKGQWDIALRDLDFALSLDQDGDGELTWGEIRQQHAAIATYALGRLALSAQGQACIITPGEQLIDHHTDGAYTVLRFTVDCPNEIASLGLDYRLFADLDPQHKGLVKLTNEGATSTAIFSPDHAQQALAVAGASRWRQFADYVRHGTWHIWIGFDHILFLLSLLLPAVRAGGIKTAFVDVLKVVTAFTVAHSITLTLAGLHVIALPSRWVESAIAASVLLAAMNNLVPLFPGRRPQVAFAFGLIHGFGFAGVLADLGLPQAALLWSLLSFNVGVELGQLAIVAAFLPLAFLVRRLGWYRPLMGAGSVAIAVVATVWLAERLFDFRVLAA
jgi:hypothetical protein